jgi:linoleoyl-CoA desaturase
MNNSFAIHVLENTSSFAVDSWWMTWLGGGLNCHTIHHIFPEVCQIHFRPLTKILVATCKEYGIPMKIYPSTWAALVSHIKLLNQLSKNKKYAPAPFTDWELKTEKMQGKTR